MHLSEEKRAALLRTKKILETVLIIGLFLFFVCHPSFYTKVKETGTILCKKRILFMVAAVPFGLSAVWYRNRLSERQRKRAAAVLFLATPFFCVFTLEYSNIMKNRFLWGVITGLGIRKFVLTVFVLAVFLFCLLVLTNSYRWSAALLSLVVCVFGVANYFVYSLRGIPILVPDLLIAGTALNVAGEYEYQLDYPTFSLIFTTVLWWILLAWPGKVRVMRRRLRAVAAVAAALLFGLFVKLFIYSGIFSVSLNTCNPHKTYRSSGSVLTVIRSIQMMIVEKPEDYSAARAEEIAAAYPGEEGVGNTPNIIIVMDEAFADLQAIRDFKTSEEVMPFYHSLRENAIKGEMYVSSFGGKTANTEFEVLTGDTIGFLPPASTPYQIFVKHRMQNLNTSLQKLGYENTTAMHPFNETSYNRQLVYHFFEFDQVLFKRAFAGAATVHGRVSDEADFDRIIEEYEKAREAGNAPFFVHNVTMQNHSPYDYDPTQLGDGVIRVEDEEYKYNDVESYLTLIRKSDQALEKLITYFQQVKEPTVILFFGDHQPALNDEFYTKLLGKAMADLTDEELMQKYHTPYVIWANFDIEEKEMDISSNYLTPIMREAAGMALTGYNQFLLKLHEELPILSLNGYWDKNGDFYKVDDESSPCYGMLQEYNILQYNHMFDEENAVEDFFD